MRDIIGPEAGSEGGSCLLPDTHAHLDAPVFAQSLDDVIDRACDAGVYRILAVGSDAASSTAAVALAQRYDMVFAAVGIHPHEAARFSGDAAAVQSLLREKKVVAVGEIGLDYYRRGAGREEQLEAFREQLRWAALAGLPVSVHNREADSDILVELREAGSSAILHCFSGSAELAQAALADGHTLSFAGNITFPRADALRQVASTVPPERLLIETDAPVLAPQPWRGRTNEPAYLAATAQALADCRNIPPPQLSVQLCVNAEALFHWGAP